MQLNKHLNSSLLSIGSITGLLIIASIYISQVLLPHYPGIFLHDDSFFYLKIAHNLSMGRGSTFDGINTTNGYHPLYLLILAAISKIVPLQGINGTVAVFLFDMLGLIFSILVIDFLLKHLNINLWLRIFALVSIIGSIGFNDFSMEARLLLPLAWLFVFLLARINLEKKSNLLLLGILGGLIFLTRLDAILFVFLVAMMMNLRYFSPPYKLSLKNYLYRLVLLLLPVIIFLISYLIFNKLTYGHTASISSWLKMGWRGPLTGWDGFILTGFQYKVRVIFCFATSFTLLVYLGSKMRRSRSFEVLLAPNILLVLALNLYVVGYLGILFLFSQAAYPTWYLALPLSINFFTIAFLVNTFFKNEKTKLLPLKMKNATVLIMISMSLLFLYNFLNYKIRGYDRWNDIKMGTWMKENLPPDTRIFQADNTGFTGYFSERSVIDGDGRVNSWEYFEDLLNNRLKEYLIKYKVEYFLSDDYREGIATEIHVPLSDKGNDQMLSFIKPPKEIIKFGQFVLYKTDITNVVVRLVKPIAQ